MSLKDALGHYLDVRDGRKDARFLEAKATPASFSRESETSELWREHERIEQGFECSGECRKSFLDLKIEIGDRMLRNCSLCHWRCGVDRKLKPGRCGVTSPRVASEFLHYGEEAPLVPSHTIFFSGCTMNCVFCQNWDISQNPSVGVSIPEDRLAALIEERRRMGSANVNFVGGDPTPALPYILRVLRRISISVPVVWNSNMYLSQESMRLLSGIVDLYLTDFKFGNSDCALKLAGVRNYFEVVSENHLRIRGEDLIIRHLVIPGHIECCTKPIISWVANNLGKDIVMNIMGQYRPLYRASWYPELNRYPSREELEEARRWALREGIENLI
ncbi:radical SAM protein [Methanothermobacter sp. THM-2]|uniref:radical SAM protein n=1 Tax=Methanothermobacter sp. THM-2 TaxID=2606912 RepID=UPI0013651B8A|nr:radical SAM protein [Methanothermobacter sp. THM-2]QHN07925.1 radical SAM protein [Methanothermobacter sp. THM-2]